MSLFERMLMLFINTVKVNESNHDFKVRLSVNSVLYNISFHVQQKNQSHTDVI